MNYLKELGFLKDWGKLLYITVFWASYLRNKPLEYFISLKCLEIVYLYHGRK